jgi:class 3 adenylate cyclase
MPASMARHDQILSEAIGAYQGVVFRTVGDAFFAAFRQPIDALAAALAAQRALHTEPWGVIGTMRVRMALHTSAVDLRDGGYFGPPLNRVARLLAAGHGGQTLLCRATEELIRNQLPQGAVLRDMGEHQLRDLTLTEQIFQLHVADLPDDFPPLKTLTNQAADQAPATPEAYITRQHMLPGMPSVDFDAVLQKERQRKVKTTRSKPKSGGGGLF